MPFTFADVPKKDERAELPPGLNPEDLRKLIVAALSEHIQAMLQEALRPHLFDLTGNVDYLPARPERKK